MIEISTPFIEELLVEEPWRAEADTGQMCEAPDIDWDGSAYWVCNTCGRIGTSHTPHHHRQAVDVATAFYELLVAGASVGT